MLFADICSPEYYLTLFSRYHTLAYPVLFLGAFLETLIPFSLVIYGELFFIAGAVLAGAGKLDIWLVAAVLYVGGILGDNSSYWLGRWYGIGLLDALARWPWTRRYFRPDLPEKGISFFRRHGQKAVFFARLCGPFSWFVPALAGVFQQSYCRFVFFNTLGVIVGIGEFLLLGYLFGNHVVDIVSWLTRLGYIPFAAALSIATVLLWRCFSHNH